MSSDIQSLEKHDNAAGSEELLILQEKNQHEYAMAVLNAQERDRGAGRGHYRDTQKTALIFLAFIGVLLLSLIFAAFHYGKDQFLIECLRYLAVGGGCGGAGYAWGYHRHGKKSG